MDTVPSQRVLFMQCYSIVLTAGEHIVNTNSRSRSYHASHCTHAKQTTICGELAEPEALVADLDVGGLCKILRDNSSNQ